MENEAYRYYFVADIGAESLAADKTAAYQIAGWHVE